MSYTLYRGFVSTFFGLCINQLVGPSIGTLVGSLAGPSPGWMHCCLSIRLVQKKFNALLSNHLLYILSFKNRQTDRQTLGSLIETLRSLRQAMRGLRQAL